MSGNKFGTDDLEKTFEQGLSTVKKTANTAVKQTTQQASLAKKAFIDQLYGVKNTQDSSPGGEGNSLKLDPNNNPSALPHQPQTDTSTDLSQFPGLTNPQEVARYHQIQSQLKGQQGGQSNKQNPQAQMTHNQNYFRKDIGTLEDQIDREKQKKVQIVKEKEQAEEEEKIEKMQAEEDAEQDFVAPQGKAKEGASRNRMGKKTGTIALSRAKNKTEMFRGASG